MKNLKGRIIIIGLVFLLAFSSLTVFASYQPPTKYSAPVNVGIIFNGDELDYDENGRWSFDIGYGASDEVRELLQAAIWEDDTSIFDEAGFNSLGVGIEYDYKIDNGQWRSNLDGYDEWVPESYAGFNPEESVWVGSVNATEYNFDEIFEDGILPGGKSYFDNHTIYFRVRFTVGFYNSDTGTEYEYYSPWSSEVSYSNNQKPENPAVLINHAPNLLSVELKKYDDGQPYLDFKASKAHDDVQLLNNISNQRIFTNVWLKVNNGPWVDAGSYMSMTEQFTVDANDYFVNAESYDSAVYEAKFRYSFDLAYYPLAGKSGDVYSPFSNVISHGMPAYSGASTWATTELDKAAEYGLIPDILLGADMTKQINREEFCELAVLLYEKSSGKTSTPANPNPFTDTVNSQILKAYKLGITAGTSATAFTPKKLITREECAAMLFRAIKAIEPNGDYSITGVPDFPDQKNIYSWAVDATKYMSKIGIIKGDSSGNFMPKATTTVQQAAGYGMATREAAILMAVRTFENMN